LIDKADQVGYVYTWVMCFEPTRRTPEKHRLFGVGDPKLPIHQGESIMAFTIPDKDNLSKFGVAGLEDLRNIAEAEVVAIRASATQETATAEQVEQITMLASFIGDVDAELDAREANATGFNTPIPVRASAVNTPVEQPQFDETGVKDAASTVTTPSVQGRATDLVSATVVAAGSTVARTPGVADVAPYQPDVDIKDGKAFEEFSIVAAAPLILDNHNRVDHNQVMDWAQLGLAIDQAAMGHAGKSQVSRVRTQDTIARFRRNAPDTHTILARDDHESAFSKLEAVANGLQSLEAANVGWCAPSPPDYSICSPITADGIATFPSMVLNRGGLLHNQGLDFGDFFNNDLVLPIPGYNILTEAEVISGTAKTCLDIPCPTFVDDRLNVAALCLTGSLLQNRGYPEFVSTFVSGAMDAMAHLVNREIINAIVTGSTAVPLAAVNPWTSDGTVLSQLLSAVEMAVMDLRYAYRTNRNQSFDVKLPYWILAQLRADYVRENARANNDIADSELVAMFSQRGANVEFVYDWQDAFNPGALAAANQAGNATPITSLPFSVAFLIYLPGTWVVGRQSVIRLDLVYDSTNLAQNKVTQIFVEDGFKPMRMCQFSRAYTVPICPSGSTGAQRLVSCA
jgi:hypothetical protein